MGNSVIRKLSHCCACNNGGSHDRVTDVMPLHPALEFVGHSFSYVRPDPTSVSSGSKVHSLSDSSSSSAKTTTFRSISGASLGSNLTTLPLGTSPVADRPANLESSELVASLSLQPVPLGTTYYCWSSGPVEGGFLTGQVDKFQRSLSDGGGFKTKNNKTLSLMSSFKRAISDKMLKVFVSDKELLSSDTERSNENLLARTSGSLSFDDDHGDKNDDINDDDDDHHCSMKSQNLQWAQGKAGEDRIHLVVSEEKGWIFAGIYDGFSGADAPDHLVANLFNAVFEELKGLLSNTDKSESGEEICGKCELMGSETNSSTKSFRHSDVLKALSVALNKTEETYHQVADSKPQLHIIGSCVLVMLMNGEDVYLMNVGDSRAILAQKSGSITNNSQIEPPLVSRQLTKDHNADVEEEVERIRKEHPDDEDAVFNDRVKGYLRVTRAFGCGFLKKPKWNDAIFAIFRINYVGTSPYITSSPSLRHYKLSPKDKFLILSSDGLYEHFTNQQVVSEVEWFTATFPDRDPAKHLIEEVLIRAAKKHGLKFHELVKIPPGKRRLYHDDVSVIIISLEGRIWRSSANTNNTQLVA